MCRCPSHTLSPDPGRSLMAYDAVPPNLADLLRLREELPPLPEVRVVVRGAVVTLTEGEVLVQTTRALDSVDVPIASRRRAGGAGEQAGAPQPGVSVRTCR